MGWMWMHAGRIFTGLVVTYILHCLFRKHRRLRKRKRYFVQKILLERRGIIGRSSTDPNKGNETLFTNLVLPTVLAYDWISNNIYVASRVSAGKIYFHTENRSWLLLPACPGFPRVLSSCIILMFVRILFHRSRQAEAISHKYLLRQLRPEEKILCHTLWTIWPRSNSHGSRPRGSLSVLERNFFQSLFRSGWIHSSWASGLCRKYEPGKWQGN